MEMMYMMLGYIEVVTNIEFIKISAMLLELHAGVKIESNSRKVDVGSYLTIEIDSFWYNVL